MLGMDLQPSIFKHTWPSWACTYCRLHLRLHLLVLKSVLLANISFCEVSHLTLWQLTVALVTVLQMTELHHIHVVVLCRLMGNFAKQHLL